MLVGLLRGWLLCCGFDYDALSCAFIGCGVDVCLFVWVLVSAVINSVVIIILLLVVFVVSWFCGFT